MQGYDGVVCCTPWLYVTHGVMHRVTHAYLDVSGCQVRVNVCHLECDFQTLGKPPG